MTVGFFASRTLAERVARRGVARTADLERVRRLPRRPCDPSSAPDLSPLYAIEDHGCPGCDLCRDGMPRLRPIQSFALWEASRAGGLMGFIGVGHGKELLSLLLPDAMGARNAVVLTKPRLMKQLLGHDVPRYGRHFRLPMDRITVVAYSELSGADTGDVLERIQPDLVVANEAHCLSVETSARGRWFRRFADSRGPATRYCFLSGTMGRDSILSYAHLSFRALRNSTPQPTGYRELRDWALALDSDVADHERLPPGELLGLCGPEGLTKRQETPRGAESSIRDVIKDPLSVARSVYRRRLVETPGVVATEESGVDCSLVINAWKPEIPESVKTALKELRRTWSLGGEEFVEAMEVARASRQLASGYYYRWAWPGGKRDDEWLDARAEWNRAVRHVLRYRSGSFDPPLMSPLMVEREAERGSLEVSDMRAWDAWSIVRGRYRPQPPTEAVWLSPFLVDAAVEWAEACTDDAPGIVWYQSLALEEAFRARGLEVYGADDDGILSCTSRHCFASTAHRDGKNLQRFSRALVLEPFANGGDWEQLIGREHRPGQRAHEVWHDVAQHDEALRAAFASARRDARFDEAAHGQRQKLNVATLIGFDEEG